MKKEEIKKGRQETAFHIIITFYFRASSGGTTTDTSGIPGSIYGSSNGLYTALTLYPVDLPPT